jgi:hypothetical protein
MSAEGSLAGASHSGLISVLSITGYEQSLDNGDPNTPRAPISFWRYSSWPDWCFTSSFFADVFDGLARAFWLQQDRISVGASFV